jgi:hypothetical protein
MRGKAETFAKLKKFKQQIKGEINLKTSMLRFDHGGEFPSTKFNNYCNEHGFQ